MSVIIRLQNLPLTASSLDIRNFFHGLSIPDGGVHIVGGPEGDAFIAFSTDEDARQAMRITGQPLKGSPVSLLLSSRNEMYKVIEQARLAAMGGGPTVPHQQSSMTSSTSSHSSHNSHHLGEESSPPSSHQSHYLSSQAASNHLGHNYGLHASGSISSSMSPNSSGSNDYLKGFGAAGPKADLSSNPALLFSTMSAIPSATLGGSGSPSNAFLTQQQQQSQYGLGSTGGPGATSHQQQNQANNIEGAAGNLPFGVASNPAAAAAALANGANPFMHFPPPSALTGLQFPGMIPGQGSAVTGGNPATANNPLVQSANIGRMNLTTAATVGGLISSGHGINTTMSMAGQGTSPLNPFGAPPSRMNLLNNGLSGPPPVGHQSTPTFSDGPRLNNNNNNFGSGLHSQYGAGVGAGVGVGVGAGPRQQLGHNGPRIPFGTHAATMGSSSTGAMGVGDRKNRFQFGAIPSGRMDMPNNRNGGGRDHRNRSPSRERRGADPLNRRRRSRSRDRDRGADRRRRRSNSRSRSRSRSRDRLGAKGSRRDSRDKRDSERKSRSDSSPEKSSQESGRSRREPSPSPNSTNTTSEEWPGAKLIGVPSDASYREIKEFIRVDVMGGSDGVVRLYDEGIAYLKLMSPQEFPRVYRFNGRKLRGSVVSIEGITMETWTQEYKLNKSRIERDIDREKEEREKEHERDKEGRRSDRDHRDHRSDRHHSSHSSHRSSRFSNASHQSNCIAIRGLAPTITRQELATRYLQETPFQDLVLIAAPTPTNRHSVTAFIQFESWQIAQGVIDLIARSPLGTSLVVESCDPEDLQMAKVRTSGGAPTIPASNFGGSRSAHGAVGQDAKSIFDLDLGLDDETTTVIMKGAPPNITERDVFDFYSDIGLAPMNVKIFRDADGQCSGNVVCEFVDNNKAKRATTKDGMLFGRGQISVSLLPSRSSARNLASVGGNLSTLGGSSEFPHSGGAPQNPFNRNQNPRPGLLGAGPNRTPSEAPFSRFPNPNPSSNSMNIFEQALQQQSGPENRAPGTGRSRGPSGERMSRFSSANDSRGDFRSQNGSGRGRGRGRGGVSGSVHPRSKPEDAVTDDDLGIFNKTGCVIGLENIPYKASMDDILGYLEDTLKIRIAPNMIIRRYDDNQKPTGDARVAFNTEFEAKLACDRLKGTYMWKRPITATPVPDSDLDLELSASPVPAVKTAVFCKRRLRKIRAVKLKA